MLNKDVNKVILVFDGDRIPIKQLASNARKKKGKQRHAIDNAGVADAATPDDPTADDA